MENARSISWPCANCGAPIKWRLDELLYARERIARGDYAAPACDDDCAAALEDPWRREDLDWLIAELEGSTTRAEWEVQRWGESDRWIVSFEGLSDQPTTERELELRGGWFGPFASESDAEEWAKGHAETTAD